jgi:hypothetical protein
MEKPNVLTEICVLKGKPSPASGPFRRKKDLPRLKSYAQYQALDGLHRRRPIIKLVRKGSLDRGFQFFLPMTSAG